MKTMLILFKAEFKRFWTLGMILLSLFLVALGSLSPIMMTNAGMFKKLSQLSNASEDLISFFVLLIFYGGIVSADIKSGWLRTLLTRAVTRQQYLVTKMLVALAATATVYLLAFSIPAIYVSFDEKIKLIYDWSDTLISLSYIFAQFSLLIVLSTLVSCGMPGAFNGVIVYAWMILSQMIGFLVDRMYWDVPWAVVMKDYIFPSGFSDAMTAIAQNLPFPYVETLWGLATLTFFLSLTFFSINKVVVDVGSE